MFELFLSECHVIIQPMFVNLPNFAVLRFHELLIQKMENEFFSMRV